MVQYQLNQYTPLHLTGTGPSSWLPALRRRLIIFLLALNKLQVCEDWERLQHADVMKHEVMCQRGFVMIKKKTLRDPTSFCSRSQLIQKDKHKHVTQGAAGPSCVVIIIRLTSNFYYTLPWTNHWWWDPGVHCCENAGGLEWRGVVWRCADAIASAKKWEVSVDTATQINIRVEVGSSVIWRLLSQVTRCEFSDLTACAHSWTPCWWCFVFIVYT